jgi:hypothetical protein
MLERQMEDLIAAWPEEFFPDRGLRLLGRQGVLAGVGRYDLLFEDRHGMKYLMELKAVTARFEHASQLANYQDELRLRGENRVYMWLVAPHLPHSVREQLETFGIEYTEIHAAYFQQVADRHGVQLPEAPPLVAVDPPKKPRRTAKARPIIEQVREFLKTCIRELWIQQSDWVTRNQLIDALDKQAWAAERLDSVNIIDPEDRRKRLGNWIDWFSAHYEQGFHGLAREFERTENEGTWAWRPLNPGQPEP